MNILKSFAASAAVAMTLVSCGEKPSPVGPDEPQGQLKPVFPSLVEDNAVVPGSTLTLSFDANMDWTVTVPSENLQWFWIEDNSFKVDKVSGKVAAGNKEKVTVEIGVSETEEFDTNRSCEVTLTMGGESKVIAKYMRPAKDMVLAVYAAKVENGTFVHDEEGGYVYESVAVTSADMLWSAEDADFRLPVKIEANCEWTADVPDWMDLQIEGSTVGVVETVLKGASVEAASGEVVFASAGKTLGTLTVNIPSCGEVAVYSALIDENGEFVFDESGEYAYTEEPVEEVRLVWPGTDFRMPVYVDAKCDWTVELPEWLTIRYPEEVPASRAGKMAIVLMGNPLKYPLEDETGKMIFKYDGQTVHEVDVTIPGCADRFSFGLNMSLSEWEFNAAGDLMTSVGYQDLDATAWFSGTETASVYVAGLKDGKFAGYDPEWLTVDVQAYVKGDEILQQRTVTVSPSVNDGEERRAYILFSKDGDAGVFFNADGTIAEEMKNYAVQIVQHGSDIDYVTILSSESDMASAGVTFAPTENPRLESYFGQTKYIYEMKYSNVYARDAAYMSFAKPYSSYKVFDAARKDMTSDGNFWLQFVADEGKTGGVIDMYMDMEPSKNETTGYVVFYDADGSVLAIISCVFDPNVVVEEVVVEFTEMAAQYASMTGASLEHLTEGPVFDQFSEGMYTVYHLTYKMEGMPLKIKVPASVKKHNVNPYSYRTFFRVNDLVYDEYFGPDDILGEVGLDDESAVEVYMKRPEQQIQIGKLDLPENVYMAVINFNDKADNVVFVLVCTLDLSE